MIWASPPFRLEVMTLGSPARRRRYNDVWKLLSLCRSIQNVAHQVGGDMS